MLISILSINNFEEITFYVIYFHLIRQEGKKLSINYNIRTEGSSTPTLLSPPSSSSFSFSSSSSSSSSSLRHPVFPDTCRSSWTCTWPAPTSSRNTWQWGPSQRRGTWHREPVWPGCSSRLRWSQGRNLRSLWLTGWRSKNSSQSGSSNPLPKSWRATRLGQCSLWWASNWRGLEPSPAWCRQCWRCRRIAVARAIAATPTTPKSRRCHRDACVASWLVVVVVWGGRRTKDHFRWLCCRRNFYCKWRDSCLSLCPSRSPSNFAWVSASSRKKFSLSCFLLPSVVAVESPPPRPARPSSTTAAPRWASEV